MSKFLGGILRSSYDGKAGNLTKYGFHIGDIPDSAVEVLPLNYKYNDETDNKDLFIFVRYGFQKKRYITEVVTIGNKTTTDYSKYAKKGHAFGTIVKKYNIVNIFRVSGKYRTVSKRNNLRELTKIKPLEMTSGRHHDTYTKNSMLRAKKNGNMEKYDRLHNSIIENKRSRRKYTMQEVDGCLRRQLKNRLQKFKTERASKITDKELNLLVARVHRQYADYVMGLNPNFVNVMPKDNFYNDENDNIRSFLNNLANAKHDFDYALMKLKKDKTSDYYNEKVAEYRKDLYEIVKNFR